VPNVKGMCAILALRREYFVKRVIGQMKVSFNIVLFAKRNVVVNNVRIKI